MSGFGQILDDLDEAGVEYVLIDGIAMIRHGVVRATRDIDAAFDPTEENVSRIRALIARWKRLAGRERDLADLADLEAAHGELPTAGS